MLQWKIAVDRDEGLELAFGSREEVGTLRALGSGFHAASPMSTVAFARDRLMRRVRRARALGAEDVDGVRARRKDRAPPLIEDTPPLERPQCPFLRCDFPALALNTSFTLSRLCGPDGCQNPIRNCE